MMQASWSLAPALGKFVGGPEGEPCSARDAHCSCQPIRKYRYRQSDGRVYLIRARTVRLSVVPPDTTQGRYALALAFCVSCENKS